MNGIGTAQLPEHEPFECDECGGPFVMQDVKVCNECGYIPGATRSQDADPWCEWHKSRRKEYSSFRGTNRVKMVGGFTHPYFDD